MTKVTKEQPFVQPKSELDDQENRREIFELDLGTPRYELDGREKVEKGTSDRPPEMGEIEWATELGFLSQGDDHRQEEHVANDGPWQDQISSQPTSESS